MYPNFDSNSAKYYERAKRVMPGGNTRETVYFPPYPLYAKKAQGAFFVDADGVERLDFVNNYSSLIHGHSHPKVVEAVRNQASELMCIGLPSQHEILLAELLCDRLPGLEQVRFCNSGSEAVMFAVKAARAFTDRPKIAKIEGAFHGHYDAVETSMSPNPKNWGEASHPAPVRYAKGTPDGILSDIIVLPLNNLKVSQALLEEHRSDLAGVLIDPLISRMGFVHASLQYLEMLRNFTRDNGSLLIFDEVFSLRMGFNGAQGEFGVTPDVTALGKIIGGGFPIGAVGGRSEVMEVFNPTLGVPPAVPHGGTFNANPMAMVAGKATMELLTADVHSGLAELGDQARKGLNEALAIAGLPGRAQGHSSMIAVILSNIEYDNYRGFLSAMMDSIPFASVFGELLNQGIFVMDRGGLVLSSAMTSTNIDFLCEKSLAAFRNLATELDKEKPS